MQKKMQNAYWFIIIAFAMIITSTLSVFSSEADEEDDTDVGGGATYYTVTVNGGSGSGIYEEGDIVSITATVPDGYLFDKWLSSISRVSFLNSTNATTTFAMISSDVTINANLIDNGGKYNLTIVNGYDESETIETQKSGEKVTISALNYAENDFINWTSDNSSVVFDYSSNAITSFIMPKSDVTVRANYTFTKPDDSTSGDSSNGSGGNSDSGSTDTTPTVKTYSVVVSDGTGTGNYSEGTTVAIEASPATYEKFSHWTVVSGEIELDDEFDSSTTFKMVPESVKITANYTFSYPDEYYANIHNGYGDGYYEEGDKVTLSVTTSSTQEFLYWYSDDDVTFSNRYDPNTSFLMPAEDVEVYAYFGSSTGTGSSGNDEYFGSSGFFNDYNTSYGDETSAISTSVLGNGSIYPSGTVYVNQGSSQTFSFIPDYGYEVSFIIINGQPISPAETYTFSNVTKDQTMQVVYRNSSANSTLNFNTNPFTDVSSDDWFYSSVMMMYNNDLMNGTSTTIFSPHGGATRASISALLYRMEGSPANNSTSSIFSDVYSSQWYTDSIIWCYENGMINGYQDGTFNPTRVATKEELCSIIHRYANYKGLDMTKLGNLSGYTDVSQVSNWAKTSVSWSVGSNIIYKPEDNMIQPKELVSRAELAYVISAFLNASK